MQMHITTTHGKLEPYIPSKLNINLQNKCPKYNIPHIINYTPQIVTEKVLTHNVHGFSLYVQKSISLINITALFETVTYVCIYIRH